MSGTKADPNRHSYHWTDITYVEARVRALESLMIEKGLATPDVVDAVVATFENDIGPMNGAKVIAKAWADPKYKAELLSDGTQAIDKLGYRGLQTEHDPDTVRGPDVAFWSAERLPLDQTPEAYPDVAADLCVEVMSPTDTRRAMNEKVREYLVRGVLLVWVVDPEDHTITIYRQPDEGRTRSGGLWYCGSRIQSRASQGLRPRCVPPSLIPDHWSLSSTGRNSITVG